MNNNSKLLTNYYTKDLAEASALIVKGQKLINIEREGKVCWFCFENVAACKTITDKYFYGELLVNAREFHEAMARLKNRIFNYPM